MCEKAWARTDAALVSQVLVLEQHDVAGGCTHAFEEKGFEFDVGLHYVGGDIGNTKRQMGAMLSSLCSFPVEWADQGEIFDLAKFSWGEVPMRKGNLTLRVAENSCPLSLGMGSWRMRNTCTVWPSLYMLVRGYTS
jgi:hypothetical protein